MKEKEKWTASQSTMGHIILLKKLLFHTKLKPYWTTIDGAVMYNIYAMMKFVFK